MTGPAADHFGKAERELAEARAILAIGLAESAGRAAYLAAFHAAQALIVQRTGKIARTHAGVRSEFARPARHERELVVFLARAYHLKEVADYAVSRDRTISLTEASDAVELATGFVAAVRRLAASNGS